MNEDNVGNNQGDNQDTNQDGAATVNNMPPTSLKNQSVQPVSTTPVVPVAPSSGASAPPMPAGKPRILLAEDEDDARMIYIDILDTGDFQVDAAENGNKTLDYLSANVYSLVLLDIIMPDMDGISVLGEIKKYPAKYGTPKIVMLTNIGGDLAIEKALSMGANGYMLKSETEPDELIRIIKKYLDGQDNVKPEKTLLDR